MRNHFFSSIIQSLLIVMITNKFSRFSTRSLSPSTISSDDKLKSESPSISNIPLNNNFIGLTAALSEKNLT